MAKRVVVSAAQQAAAKSIVKRDEARGRPTRGSVRAIANATFRSAATGSRAAASGEAATSPS